MYGVSYFGRITMGMNGDIFNNMLNFIEILVTIMYYKQPTTHGQGIKYKIKSNPFL